MSVSNSCFDHGLSRVRLKGSEACVGLEANELLKQIRAVYVFFLAQERLAWAPSLHSW